MLIFIYLAVGLIGLISLLVFISKFLFDQFSKSKKLKNDSNAFERKYRAIDYDSYRAMFFRVSLMLAIAFVIVAFKWTVPKASDNDFPHPEPLDIFEGEIEIYSSTEKKEPPVEKKKPLPQQKSEHIIIEPKEDPVVESTQKIDADIDESTEVREPVIAATPKEEVRDPDVPYTIVEIMPEFPGGEKAMRKYLGQTPYSDVARDIGIEGIVFIRFVIDEKGDVVNVEVAKGIHRLLDEAALNHVKKMPRWQPGLQQGKPAKVQYVLPIKFIAE